MTHYECTECGQLTRLGAPDRRELVRTCPVCGEETQWTPAFEAEGVSF